MKKRQLGNSDLFVSEVGFGCMSLGTNESEALRILDAAFAEGVNFFDTADLYEYGLNEEIVGKAIRGRRSEIVLATKVGNHWTEEKNGWFWDPSKAYIKEEVKESLRRLGTDYIDLYQLHGGTIEDQIDETIEAFEELKQEGVIRYYGISSIRPNVIREYVTRSNIVSILMEYSLLNRRPEEWFSLIKEHNVSVIARGPVAKGLLTANYRAKLEKAHDKGYLSYSYDELTATLQSLQEAVPNRSLEELAVQYCLHDEVVASIIPGASSIEQLRANVRAGGAAPLTKEEIERIQAITRPDVYEVHR